MVPLPVNVFFFPAPASTPRLKPNPMSRSKKGSRVPGRPGDGYHLYIRERVMADKGLSMTPVQLAKEHRISLATVYRWIEREENGKLEKDDKRGGAPRKMDAPNDERFADPHGCQAHNQPHRGATASGALQVSRASQRSSSLMLTRLPSSGRWCRGHTRTRRKAREPS